MKRAEEGRNRDAVKKMKEGENMKTTWKAVWVLALFLLASSVCPVFSYEIDAEQNKRIKDLEEKVSALKGGGDPESAKKEQEIQALKKEVADIRQALEASKSAQTQGKFLNTTYGTLTMKGIVQTQFDQGQHGTPSGTFLVKRARLIFSGLAPVQKVGYFIQTDATGEIFLLDAKVMFNQIPKTTVNVGRFVPAFTYYMPRTVADLDFINYPLLVTKYAPWRQVGAQIDTKFKYANFNAGIFNGYPANGWQDNNPAKDYLGRMEITPFKDFGIFGYRWEGREKPTTGPDAEKNRTGGGLSLRYKLVNVVGEYVRGYDESSTKKDSSGYYVNAGVKVLPFWELLCRYDWFDVDLNKPLDAEDWVTLGTNYFLDGNNLKFSVNYIFKREEGTPIDNDEVLAQMQVFF